MTLQDGTGYKARPTIYKGIQMRSRLEASVAAFLDREELDWEYEPVVFADERVQYLPDFKVNGLTGAWPMFVDVKGPRQSDDELSTLFERMGAIWASTIGVLAVWSADLFGIEGYFPVRLPDGRSPMSRVQRCGPCGGVTLYPTCRLCGRSPEPISPLIDVRPDEG